MEKPKPDPVVLSKEEARAYLVGHLGLGGSLALSGSRGLRKCLERLRCIQLDPLDVIGTNADLVAMARVDKIGRGDIFRHVYPGHAFEHFAKERCLLPASAYPYYREQAAETPWWRLSQRLERLPEGILEAVLEEIRERGPITPRELTDRGEVVPMNWSGWKGTKRAVSMAIEVLWTRCQIIVCGRRAGTRVYDVPERALPGVASVKAGGDFARWALLERVEAAGLLPLAGGPHWSMLSHVRGTPLPDELVREEKLIEVLVEGSPRRHLAPRDLKKRRFPRIDGRMRILGPLDPLLWNRPLVNNAFGFEYVWEVYKPEKDRRWGWYVCPLLHKGELVGRIEAVVEGETLKVKKLWREKKGAFDDAALDEALARHAEGCGAVRVTRPRRLSR